MSRKRIFQAAGIISGITILSRIFGLVRTTLISQIFGASAFQDAFIAAFEIPNLLRRVLGEGSLSAIIVPLFTEKIEKEGKRSAWEFLSNILNVLAVITAVLTIGGFFLAPWIVRLFMWGYYKRGDMETLALATQCTRIMMPVMLLLALTALLMGVFNSLKKFALPAFGSIFLNICMITACVISLHKEPIQFITILSVSVTIGMLVRFLALYIPLRKSMNFTHSLRCNFSDSGFKQLLFLMVPGALGMLIAHFNILIDKMLATLLGVGCSTYLNNANFLVQFPLAIFAGAIGTAVIPSISRNLVRNEPDKLRKNMAFAFEFVMILLLPCLFGYILLRENLVAMLFQRQNWLPEDSVNAGKALMFYSTGFLFFGFHRVLSALYYANKDVYTPLKTGAISMLVNIVLNFLLIQPIFHLDFGGLALATSIATGTNVFLLQFFLQKKLKISPDWNPIIRTFSSVLILNLILGAIVFLVKRNFFADIYLHGLPNAAFLTITVLAYASLYFLAISFIHPEGKRITGMIRRKITGK